MTPVFVITHNNVEYNDCWYDLDNTQTTQLTQQGFTSPVTAQTVADGLNLDYIAKGLQVIGQTSDNIVEHACDEDALSPKQRALDRKDYIWNEDHPFIINILSTFRI